MLNFNLIGLFVVVVVVVIVVLAVRSSAKSTSHNVLLRDTTCGTLCENESYQNESKHNMVQTSNYKMQFF
jgi:hypothetical protein